MTRSDLMLEVNRHDMTLKEKTELIYAMYEKIEGAYAVLFLLELEKDKHFEVLAKVLRNALEK